MVREEGGGQIIAFNSENFFRPWYPGTGASELEISCNDL